MLDLLFGGRRLSLNSPFSIAEATSRLQRDIAVPKWRAFENRPQAFVGTFADGRFEMARLVGGRNSLRPMIDGQLSPLANGCRVDARLKMPLIGVFACFLFLLIGTGMLWVAIPQAVLAARDGVIPTRETLFRLYLLVIALPMLVMSVLVPIVEARKATRLLIRVFDGAVSPR